MLSVRKNNLNQKALKLFKKQRDMQQKCMAILDSFEILKKILKDRAVCMEDIIIIFDQVLEKPFTIKIVKNERKIQFFSGDEEIAILSPKTVVVEDEYKEVVEEWLNALTSLGFKRYIPKF